MLKRTLAVERTYPLGDYKNIKLYDSITDIPEELAFNEVFMENVRALQLIGIDLAFRRYGKLASEQSQYKSLDENIHYLMEKELQTLDEIKNYLKTLIEKGEEENAS